MLHWFDVFFYKETNKQQQQHHHKFDENVYHEHEQQQHQQRQHALWGRFSGCPPILDDPPCVAFAVLLLPPPPLPCDEPRSLQLDRCSSDTLHDIFCQADPILMQHFRCSRWTTLALCSNKIEAFSRKLLVSIFRDRLMELKLGFTRKQTKKLSSVSCCFRSLSLTFSRFANLDLIWFYFISFHYFGAKFLFELELFLLEPHEHDWFSAQQKQNDDWRNWVSQ